MAWQREWLCVNTSPALNGLIYKKEIHRCLFEVDFYIVYTDSYILIQMVSNALNVIFLLKKKRKNSNKVIQQSKPDDCHL